MTTVDEAIAELKKRGVTVSSESVLEEKGTTFEEFKKLAESTLKGSAKGTLIDIIGGYGNQLCALNSAIKLFHIGNVSFPRSKCHIAYRWCSIFTISP